MAIPAPKPAVSASATPAQANSAPPRGGPQSVGRVIGILECLADMPGGTTLSELATIVSAPKTSLVGLLAGLTDEDFLARKDSGRYVLGPRFLALAARVTGGRDLPALVRPILTRLSGETGETAVLAALAPTGETVIYLDTVESTSPIRFAVTVGISRELYCTAAGKLLLARFTPRRLGHYLRSVPRTRFTDTTITADKALRAELAAVKLRGMAESRSERIAGSNGLAAPILGPGGSVQGILAIAGPSDRMEKNAGRNEAALRAAAEEASRIAGGEPRR